MVLDNEDFIQEVSTEESLWNIKSKAYHDKVAKYVSWTKVAKTCVNGFENLGDKDKDAKITELQKRWKNLRDNYRKKCVTKSGQAVNKKKKYMYADIMKFLRPTMENRKTEGNIDDSFDSPDGNEMDQTTNTSELIVDDEEQDNLIAKKSKKIKMDQNQTKSTFEDSLLEILGNRRQEDEETTFLMSLVPQIKKFNQDQKNQLYIEFISAIQRVKYNQVNMYSQPLTTHETSHHQLQPYPKGSPYFTPVSTCINSFTKTTNPHNAVHYNDNQFNNQTSSPVSSNYSITQTSPSASSNFYQNIQTSPN